MHFTTKHSKSTTATLLKENNQHPCLKQEDSKNAVAVIGMSCRFPRAKSLEELWDLISPGEYAAGPTPKDYFDISGLWREPNGSLWEHFINNPASFDHRFFKISSRDAKSMDSRQRLLIPVVYEAMESAGHSSQFRNQESHIGCYIGVDSTSYVNILSDKRATYSSMSSSKAFISDRISHCFGWSGPSITFDTACSSSAVAIHSACKALEMNECSMAVAGGVNVTASFLSPMEGSKKLGAKANSSYPSEGAGVLVLKLLSRAVADGDDILGFIKCSGIGHNSNYTPISTLDPDSRTSLYQSSLFTGDAEPEDATYHETDTLISDHTEAISSIARVIKALLMIQHRILEQYNFVSLNIPALVEDSRNIGPCTSLKITIAMNNYSAAGSNNPLLVREYSPGDGQEAQPLNNFHQLQVPFLISASTPETLKAYCTALDSFVSKTVNNHTNGLVADIAYNLAKKRNQDLEYFYAFPASTLEAVSAHLKAGISGSAEFKRTSLQSQPVVLCFGDQTGQTIRLSGTIFNDSNLLQTHLIECDSICRKFGLPSLFPRIFDNSPVEDLVHLHCMLFSLQYSVAKSWIDTGLEVDTLIGHGFGQLTALCVSGCLSIKDGIYLVSERARLIQHYWDKDTSVMLSIEGDKYAAEDLLELTKETSPSAYSEVVCYDGPRNIVVSGTEASIKATEDVLQSKGLSPYLKLVKLTTSHAYDSKVGERMLPGMRKILDAVEFRAPLIRVETCSSGKSWDIIDAEKVLQHTKTPIYFSEAVKRVARRVKSGVWLEASSASSIIPMAQRVLEAVGISEHYTFVRLDLGVSTGQHSLAHATCALSIAGSRATFWPFHHSRKSGKYRWLSLPPYQFQRTESYTDLDPKKRYAKDAPSYGAEQQPEVLQLLPQHDRENEFLFSVDTENEFFRLSVQSYEILGQSLCPVSIFCELVLQAVKIVAGAVSSLKVPKISNLVMESPLGLNPTGNLLLRLSEGMGGIWSFTIFTGSANDFISALTCHASGVVSFLDSESASLASQALKQLVANSRHEIMSSPNTVRLSGERVYKLLGRNVNYASYYQGIQKVISKDREIASCVSIPENQPPNLLRGCSDSVAIDIFLQVASIHVNCLSKCAADEVFMCTMIGELSWSNEFINRAATRRQWTVYSNFEAVSEKRVTSNIFVVDPVSKNVVVTITGVLSTAVSLTFLRRTLSKLNSSQQSVTPTTGAATAGHCSQLNGGHYNWVNNFVDSIPMVDDNIAVSVYNDGNSAARY